MTATGTITQSLDSELTSQMTPNSPNAVANHPRRDPPVPPIGAASGVSGGAPFDPGYPSSICITPGSQDPGVVVRGPNAAAG